MLWIEWWPHRRPLSGMYPCRGSGTEHYVSFEEEVGRIVGGTLQKRSNAEILFRDAMIRPARGIFQRELILKIQHCGNSGKNWDLRRILLN